MLEAEQARCGAIWAWSVGMALGQRSIYTARDSGVLNLVSRRHEEPVYVPPPPSTCAAHRSSSARR
jgi:hypothetical protein